MTEISTRTESTPRFLRIRDVMDLTGLSRSYVYDLVGRGVFPKPIAIVQGGSAKAWISNEVYAWMDVRIAERDQEVVNA